MLFALKSSEKIAMKMLSDICVVDYLHYGKDQWETEKATCRGFSRGRFILDNSAEDLESRFSIVYHLLSMRHKKRIRVVSFLDDDNLHVDSVCSIWPNASWYEREAYDLFGVYFKDHPDLRRILTDYGFIGYPFRKDFPISGHVEMRYDAKLSRCVYDPVDIQPRETVPKVIRRDNRYSKKQSLE